MSARPLTIFVEGIWRRPGRFRRWAELLSQRGIDSVEWAYDSSGRISLGELGRRLAQEIRSHTDPVRVLGFSMGGLIIREAHRLDPKLHIARAAFLNTPHRGTWTAWTLPLAAVRQMRPNSDFLQALDTVEWRIPAIAVHCPGDAMVLPGTRARFAHALESIASPIPAHMWPVYSPAIRRRVIEFLAGGSAPTNFGSKAA